MTNFLLVPGAGGDAWYWHRVVAELADRRHTAIAVELPADDPTAGLDRYADVTVDAGQGLADVVVVGQSMGGFTAPLVCGRLPVRHLVLLNAMIPRPAETGGDWWANTRHEMPSDFDVETHFFHDVPADVRSVGLAGGKEQSGRPFGDPWQMDAWPEVPTPVIALTDDRFFPLEFQRRVALDRLNIEPEVRQDVENNGFRWVTVGAPGQDVDIVLSQPHGGRAPAEGDAPWSSRAPKCSRNRPISSGVFATVRFATRQATSFGSRRPEATDLAGIILTVLCGVTTLILRAVGFQTQVADSLSQSAVPFGIHRRRCSDGDRLCRHALTRTVDVEQPQTEVRKKRP